MKKLNNKGFSLAEIVIAMGLMGVAALGYMKFQQNQMKGQKTIQNRAFIDDFTYEFKGYLSRPGICNKSFEDTSMTNGTTIDGIKRPDGVYKYKVGEKLPGSSYMISSLVLEDVYIDKTETQIEIYRGEGSLKVTFEKLDKASYGGNTLTKNIELDFTVNRLDKMQECAPIGKLVLPTSMLNREDKDETKKEDSLKADMNTAFEESANEMMKKTGTKIDQGDINKAIQENPDLMKAMESLKSLQKTNENIEKLLNSN
ncbi:prepilin-type N-terminal cleavage/methylation domain-containing protein [Bacteriovorax sp. Seq25_V]|uniref:type IV pilus modification PilV family protein n=1 Tax=Bacteriovorax sp. Seq25_V TaxID=1201288 RepID=UPI00038A51CA|nr:prepilin-type N-terminal cleavage/methylation domain-containing protein [Bacteriovorax sp. Seq25_V]EQC47532.1 prepilin-type cleavage/methylation N-terminal domain protein [Bacteriovorax sp. Seq25_V]